MAADKQFKCSSLALPSELFLDKAFFVDYIPTHPTKCLCLFCHFMKMGNNIIINTKVKIYTIRIFYLFFYQNLNSNKILKTKEIPYVQKELKKYIKKALKNINIKKHGNSPSTSSPSTSSWLFFCGDLAFNRALK